MPSNYCSAQVRKAVPAAFVPEIVVEELGTVMPIAGPFVEAPTLKAHRCIVERLALVGAFPPAFVDRARRLVEEPFRLRHPSCVNTHPDLRA